MARKRNFIYVAGPYCGPNPHDHRSYFRIHENIMRAHEVALALASLGYGFFCPHTHSSHNEVIVPHLPAAYWYELDNHFLAACDAILVLSGESAGVQAEIALAYSLEIPVFFSIVDLVNAIPPFEGTGAKTLAEFIAALPLEEQRAIKEQRESMNGC